jgi:hypothetical protein
MLPVVATPSKQTSTTLAKRRLNGDGPAFVRIGRSVRYRQSDLDCWMDASTTLLADRRSHLKQGAR